MFPTRQAICNKNDSLALVVWDLSSKVNGSRDGLSCSGFAVTSAVRLTLQVVHRSSERPIAQTTRPCRFAHGASMMRDVEGSGVVITSAVHDQ